MNKKHLTNDEGKKLTKETDHNEKPNEMGGFYFSSSVKVSDPNSKEILLFQRGDN